MDATGRVTDAVTVVVSLDFSEELDDTGLDFLLDELEIGTRGGISLGGAALLNPDFLMESRPDSLPLSVLGLLRLSLELLLSGFSVSFLSFSSGGMIGLEGLGSLPILLHV